MQFLTEAITVQGHYRGCPGKNCTIFKGIPYAKPPVGNLRFEPPVKPEPFQGVRKADHFSPIAMQHFTDPDGLYQKEFYNNPDFQFPISEDCLYLNIWTPAKQEGQNLPVAVWIHGGGLEHGFSSELEFDGETYCSKGIILVTIAYRVNAFGFLYFPEQDQKLGHSGNLGFLDQAKAIEWVHDNIAAFGGNPDNITLMGQSAGAISTQLLCISPLSRKFIRQTIMQSGGGLTAFPQLYLTKEESEAITKKYYEFCNISGFDELKELPADVLLENSDRLIDFYPFLPFRPVIDGYFLPEHPQEMAARGMLARIPCIIGSTKDDLGIPPASSHRNGNLHRSAVSYAELTHSIGYPPVYIYEFCHDLPGSEDGAFHSSELWYTFGTLDRCWRPMQETDYSLSHNMTDYWTTFMKTGNPNQPDDPHLPQWEPYTPGNPFVYTFR